MNLKFLPEVKIFCIDKFSEFDNLIIGIFSLRFEICDSEYVSIVIIGTFCCILFSKIGISSIVSSISFKDDSERHLEYNLLTTEANNYRIIEK